MLGQIARRRKSAARRAGRGMRACRRCAILRAGSGRSRALDAARKQTGIGAPGLARLAPVALGTMIVPLDSSVNVAFPAIAAAFHLAVPEIQWVVIGYVLTYGSLMLAVGRLGDIFGHARVFRFGLAWSAVAFVALCLAPDYGTLLAARVLQGIGAALVIGCGPALATGLFPETLRARALAAYGAAFAAGAALGPLLGGAMVGAFGWQGVYGMRVPIALAALLLLRGAPEAPRSGPREPFDLPGAVLLTTAIAAILFAVNRAPQGIAAALALAGAAALAGFVWRSGRAARPIMDLSLFRRPGFAALNLGNTLVNFASFAVMLLGPFWLARIAGLAAIPLGLVLAAAPAGGVLGAWLGGRLAGVLAARSMLLAGTALVAAGLLPLAWAGAGMPVGWFAALLALQGVGVGLFNLAYTDIVTAVMRREDRGVAGSLTMLTRTLGVVGAASLLTLLFGAAEAAALAAGRPAQEAFLAAFGSAFLLAGLLPLMVLPLVARRAP
jgi:MFS family permease